MHKNSTNYILKLRNKKLYQNVNTKIKFYSKMYAFCVSFQKSNIALANYYDFL